MPASIWLTGKTHPIMEVMKAFGVSLRGKYEALIYMCWWRRECRQETLSFNTPVWASGAEPEILQHTQKPGSKRQRPAFIYAVKTVEGAGLANPF